MLSGIAPSELPIPAFNNGVWAMQHCAAQNRVPYTTRQIVEQGQEPRTMAFFTFMLHLSAGLCLERCRPTNEQYICHQLAAAGRFLLTLDRVEFC